MESYPSSGELESTEPDPAALFANICLLTDKKLFSSTQTDIVFRQTDEVVIELEGVGELSVFAGFDLARRVKDQRVIYYSLETKPVEMVVFSANDVSVGSQLDGDNINEPDFAAQVLEQLRKAIEQKAIADTDAYPYDLAPEGNMPNGKKKTRNLRFIRQSLEESRVNGDSNVFRLSFNNYGTGNIHYAIEASSISQAVEKIFEQIPEGTPINSRFRPTLSLVKNDESYVIPEAAYRTLLGLYLDRQLLAQGYGLKVQSEQLKLGKVKKARLIDRILKWLIVF